MIHLMKLELMKTKINPYIRSALIANLVLFGLLGMMIYITVSGAEEETLQSFTEFLMVADVMVRGTFLVMSSVLLARLTVEEYKNRTVLQLFTYPVARKKLFIAKLMIVVIFTVATITVFSILDEGIYFLVFKRLALFSDITLKALWNQLKISLVGAILSGFISLVPFYFGMRKKSMASTILSSVILVMLLCSSAQQISSWIRLIIIGAISVLFASYTVVRKLNQLESNDF